MGDDDDSVGVGDDDVSGQDCGSAAGYGDVGFPGDVFAAEDGWVGAGGVDGDADGFDCVVVADSAVGDDAGAFVGVCTDCKDVSEGS